MASSSTLSISNLDGTTEDFKLEQDHKHKWALEEVWKTDRQTSKTRSHSKPRGVRLFERQEAEYGKNKALRDARTSRKRASPFDTDYYTSDSSAEEDVKDASAAPEPDADITYSFDAPRGPHRGSDILSMAINKAVERFETKATEKLVKDEYEVVRKEVETRNEGYTADEDYELV